MVLLLVELAALEVVEPVDGILAVVSLCVASLEAYRLP